MSSSPREILILPNTQAACWSPDSSQLLISERGSDVAKLRSLVNDHDDHSGVVFTDPGLYFVFLARHTVFMAKAGLVKTWDPTSGRQLKIIPTLSASSLSHSVTEDGTLVAECGSDGIVVIWKLSDDNAVWKRIPQGVVPYKITSFSFSNAMHQLVATVCSDGKVRVFDLHDTREIACSKEGYTRLAWFGDGRRLALVRGNTVRVASLARGKARLDLGLDYQGHNSPVVALSVCPTSRHIVSGDASGVICVWNVTTGEQVVPPVNQGTVIRTLAFSPDGKMVMLIDDLVTLRIWDLTFLDLVGEVQTTRLGLRMVGDVSTQTKYDLEDTILRQFTLLDEARIRDRSHLASLLDKDAAQSQSHAELVARLEDLRREQKQALGSLRATMQEIKEDNARKLQAIEYKLDTILSRLDKLSSSLDSTKDTQKSFVEELKSLTDLAGQTNASLNKVATDIMSKIAGKN